MGSSVEAGQEHIMGYNHEYVTGNGHDNGLFQESIELQLAALPQHIASLSSALQQSNHNLEICHDTLLQSLANESKLKKENEVIKKMRKKDNSYWRSRYVILKQEKQAKEVDCEAQMVTLHKKMGELERQNERLVKQGVDFESNMRVLEKQNRILEEQQEDLEKQLRDLHEARALDLTLLSALQDDKAALERKVVKYPTRMLYGLICIFMTHRRYKDLFSKTKEWHDNETNHMKAMHLLASHADSNTKGIREMQTNLRVRVTEMQVQFTRELEDIIIQMRQRDSQHDVKEEVLRKLVIDTEAKFLQEQHIRKALHNALIELRVFCRIRPYLDQQDSSWATTTDSPLLPMTVEDPDRVSVNLSDKPKTFDFDKVFDADAGQDVIFAQSSPLVTSLLDGYNVAIMAYGQTGSGKTYTMQGTPQEPGIIPKALELLFDTMHQNANRIQYKTEFSMVEIYNEAIYDLLDESDLDKGTKYPPLQIIYLYYC